MTSIEAQAQKVLAGSRALWNRARLDLESDEVLAQLLDYGSMDDWRALFVLMAGRSAAARQLRRRAHRLLLRVPVARPYFWLAALAGLGERIDWSLEPAIPCEEADI